MHRNSLDDDTINNSSKSNIPNTALDVWWRCRPEDGPCAAGQAGRSCGGCSPSCRCSSTPSRPASGTGGRAARACGRARVTTGPASILCGGGRKDVPAVLLDMNHRGDGRFSLGGDNRTLFRVVFPNCKSSSKCRFSLALRILLCVSICFVTPFQKAQVA